MALSLNHVHLKSPDPHATAQFYIDTLGATKIADVGEIGVRLRPARPHPERHQAHRDPDPRPEVRHGAHRH